jgi:hypothetical protein
MASNIIGPSCLFCVSICTLNRDFDVSGLKQWTVEAPSTLHRSRQIGGVLYLEVVSGAVMRVIDIFFSYY